MMFSGNQVGLENDVFIVLSVEFACNILLVLLGLCNSRYYQPGVSLLLLGSLSLKLDFFLPFHQLETSEIYS